ncbi:HIT family protein [Candidatus Woesearchaeota archaeon]|nr:HIT family protein [Candidatus Woesearchaeota archaeon]
MVSKESCLLCQIIEGKIASKKIYEDDLVLAVLDVNGANPGHCFVMPKNHHPILEQIPDFEVSRLFQTANRISSAIFENLGVQGTNLFVTNGVPAGQTVAHFMIHIIPRKENDGINLEWAPKQLTEEEMSTVELKIKEQAKNIGDFKTGEEEKVIKQPPPAPSQSSEDDDYFSKQLERIP